MRILCINIYCVANTAYLIIVVCTNPIQIFIVIQYHLLSQSTKSKNILINK